MSSSKKKPSSMTTTADSNAGRSATNVADESKMVEHEGVVGGDQQMTLATMNHPAGKKKKVEVIQQHSEVVSVTTLKNAPTALNGSASGKPKFWRRFLKWTLITLAFLFATGTLDSLARKMNANVWYATHPKMSKSEWMNVSAYEEGCITSSCVKRMIHPRPLRGEKQLLVKVVKAAGNPVDFRMRRLPIWPIKMLPSISGLDFAGTVVSADATSSYKPGDRVFGMLPTVTPYWGTFAEYVVIDEAYSAKIPEGISFTEAAATPLTALTAFQSLMHLGPVVQNQTILIHAGSGGVGSFLVQVAKKILGLKVYTTSTNVELCQSLGADYVIDYKKEDFASREYDYVIDPIGGDYLLRGISKTRKRYVSILNGGWEDLVNAKLGTSYRIPHVIPVGEFFSIVLINLRHYLSLGYYPKYSLSIVVPDGPSLEVMGNLIKRGVIRVVLDQEFVGLDEGARQLHDRLQSGRAKGKVTLSIE